MLRPRVLLASALALILLALTQSAWAGPTRTYWLHASYLLDENAPTQTTVNALKLVTGSYYFWNTTPAFSELVFPTGAWTVTVWMNITERPTQYRVKLCVNNQSGGFVELAHFFTPIIGSSSATPFDAVMSLGAFRIRTGGSLVIGLLRQWQNGSYSPGAFLFFDSASTPSRVTAPAAAAPAQTFGVGLGFAVIGIGAGVAAAGAGVAVAASGRPYSEVFAYRGYYYCRRDRIPVWLVHNQLLCPAEGRYLRP